MKIKVTKYNEHTFEGIALDLHDTVFIDHQGGIIKHYPIFEGQKIWGWYKNLPVDEVIEVHRLIAKSSFGVTGCPDGQLVLIQFFSEKLPSA